MKSIYISPRQSGKTTKICAEFIKECSKGYITYLIVVSHNQYQLVKNIIPECYLKYVYTADSFSGNCNILKVPDTLFIDDYFNILPFSRKEIYKYVDGKDIKVVIRTTSNMIYNKTIIDFVKRVKEDFVGIGLINPKLLHDYYYNFVTDVDAEVTMSSNKDIINYDYRFKMSTEHYLTECVGLW